MEALNCGWSRLQPWSLLTCVLLTQCCDNIINNSGNKKSYGCDNLKESSWCHLCGTQTKKPNLFPHLHTFPCLFFTFLFLHHPSLSPSWGVTSYFWLAFIFSCSLFLTAGCLSFHFFSSYPTLFCSLSSLLHSGPVGSLRGRIAAVLWLSRVAVWCMKVCFK